MRGEEEACLGNRTFLSYPNEGLIAKARIRFFLNLQYVPRVMQSEVSQYVAAIQLKQRNLFSAEILPCVCRFYTAALINITIRYARLFSFNKKNTFYKLKKKRSFVG